MGDRTHIEWTDATWNPLVGCTKVSPGCDNCYAEGVVNRWHAAGKPAFPARFDVVSLRRNGLLYLPLRWREPRRVFVNSLSDLFHADVPDEFIARVFAIMALAPRHTFQLLTKRHARMRSLLSDDGFRDEVSTEIAGYVVEDGLDDTHLAEATPDWWPLSNVWLGVSVEDQHWAAIRIPALQETPAAVRWISAEPLLGPIDLRHWLTCARCGGRHVFGDCAHLEGRALLAAQASNREVNRPTLDWVVTGGESGPGARPMHPHWAASLRDQCGRAGVAYLHKQNGAYLPDRTGTELAVDTAGREYPGHLRRVGKTAAGRHLEGRTHDGYPRTRVGVTP